MGRYLNVPMIATMVLDYLIMSLYVAGIIVAMGGDKFTPWLSGCAMLVLIQVTNFRDQFYSMLFPRHLASAKLDFKFWSAKDLPWDYVKLTVFFVSNSYILGYLDLFHFTLNGWSTVALISFEYWTMSILKDATVMKVVHKWMHTPSGYWLHKRHHRAGANAQILTTYWFDIVDVVLENVAGIAFQLVINNYLFGHPRMHVLSFMFLVWTDSNVHSLNPWSVCTFNPIVDLCKYTVQHNLHHYVQNDHYTVIPWHHLVSGAARDADVARYNKGMKTNVSFSLFVDGPNSQLADSKKKP